MTEYVGLDVSKEETSFCVMDEGGKILVRGKALSDPQSLFGALRKETLCPERIVLETGTLSNWLARGLRDYGLPVDVIDARQAHAVMKLQHNKTDANDAELLATIARTGFCRPISVNSEAAQKQRILLKARYHLICQRVDTLNTVRGLLGSLGLRFPKGTAKLVGLVRSALLERSDLQVMIEPLLANVEALEVQIKHLEAEVKAQAAASPAALLLQTIPGVGPVVSLAYAASMEDPERFAHSRTVGVYLGLTPRRHQSGETAYNGRISKYGDGMMRCLLYAAANSLLSTVRKAHPLKAWARRIRNRKGYKKACVALARKLAVIMHRMLITGEAFRWPEAATIKTAH